MIRSSSSRGTAIAQAAEKGLQNRAPLRGGGKKSNGKR
jgi:hypothetical protein